ncbi:MAG TPA: hypothetical protein DEP51_06150 [Clostridiales bacterium]|nr:hypothetical protein [Clostridiales bacterium]
MNLGNNKKFVEFYKKYENEFKKKPYSNYFNKIRDSFDEIIYSSLLINLYEMGILTLDNVVGFLDQTRYLCQKDKDIELSRYSKIFGFGSREFLELQSVFHNAKNRTTIPPICVTSYDKKYRGMTLDSDDILNFFVDYLLGEKPDYMTFSKKIIKYRELVNNRDKGIFIIAELNEIGEIQRIVAKAKLQRKWNNEGNNTLQFSSLKIVNLDEYNITEIRSIIEALFVEAAKKAIDVDQSFLRKQCDDGIINTQQLNDLCLNRVSYVNGNIHSTLYKEPNEEKKTNSSDLISNIYWYGKVGKPNTYRAGELSRTTIKRISDIRLATFNLKYFFPKDIMFFGKSGDEVLKSFSNENFIVIMGSNKDWYLIYEEDDEGIYIGEWAQYGAIKAENSKKIRGTNLRLAIAESTYEICKLLYRAAKRNKKVHASMIKGTSFKSLKALYKMGGVKKIEDKHENTMTFDEFGELVYENPHQKNKIYIIDKDTVLYSLSVLLDYDVLKEITYNNRYCIRRI